MKKAIFSLMAAGAASAFRAGSAMHRACWVSSVHSPGANPPSPPPIISGQPPYGADPNS